MITLVLFALVSLITRIQGNPVPDFLADGSGDWTSAPTPPLPPTGNPPPSPSDCGSRPSSGGRIVGGHETMKNSIPWQAMLRTDGGQFCGGSLVHEQWVLSAAHCVEGSSAGSFKIWLGAHRKETKEDTTQEIAVAQVKIHPSYNPNTNANDIAMIKLDRPAVLGKGVGLICLGDDAFHLPIDDLNNQCLISGWGTLESGGEQPDTLQEVLVPLVSKKRCENAYGSLHDSMLCAGLDKGGKDSCQGDSGGPLACPYNGKYYHEGATSWGSGCAGPNAYGVYAKTRHLKSWIESIIQS